MFDFLEATSRKERAGFACLASIAGFLPVAIALSLTDALIHADPKFGFGGSAVLLFFLLAMPFVGFLLAALAFALLGLQASTKAQFYAAALFPAISLFILRTVGPLPLDVQSAVAVAALSGLAVGVAFQFAASRFGSLVKEP